MLFRFAEKICLCHLNIKEKFYHTGETEEIFEYILEVTNIYLEAYIYKYILYLNKKEQEFW